jgi:hypothetical protein
MSVIKKQKLILKVILLQEIYEEQGIHHKIFIVK